MNLLENINHNHQITLFITLFLDFSNANHDLETSF